MQDENWDAWRARVDRDLAVMDRCINGNGQPGLEGRMTAQMQIMREELLRHMAASKRHTERNMEEGDGLVLDAVKRETERREEQHEENRETRKTVARMEKGFWSGFGVFMLLKFFGIDNILKMLQK